MTAASTSEVLSSIVRNESKLSLIDIRPDSSKIQLPGVIGNAISIQMGETFENAFNLKNDQFKEKFKVSLPDKGGLVILHCNDGRSSSSSLEEIRENMADIWAKYEFKYVAGGLEQWKRQFE